MAESKNLAEGGWRYYIAQGAPQRALCDVWRREAAIRARRYPEGGRTHTEGGRRLAEGSRNLAEGGRRCSTGRAAARLMWWREVGS